MSTVAILMRNTIVKITNPFLQYCSVKTLEDEWYVVIKAYNFTAFEIERFFGTIYCMSALSLHTETTDSMIKYYEWYTVYGVNMEIYVINIIHTYTTYFLPLIFSFTCPNEGDLTVEIGLGGPLPSAMSV